MTENVAWVLTRHHNLKSAAKILFAESKELNDVGLDSLSDQLLALAGAVESATYELEKISLVLPFDE